MKANRTEITNPFVKLGESNSVSRQLQKQWNAQRRGKKGSNKRGNRQVSQQEVKSKT